MCDRRWRCQRRGNTRHIRGVLVKRRGQRVTVTMEEEREKEIRAESSFCHSFLLKYFSVTMWSLTQSPHVRSHRSKSSKL